MVPAVSVQSNTIHPLVHVWGTIHTYFGIRTSRKLLLSELSNTFYYESKHYYHQQ